MSDPFAADAAVAAADDPFANSAYSAEAGDDPFAGAGGGGDDLGGYGAGLGDDLGGGDVGEDLGGYGLDLGDNGQTDAFGLGGGEEPAPELGMGDPLGDIDGDALGPSQKYLEWESNHKMELVQKRDAARAQKEEALASAREQLDSFKSDRNAMLAQSKQTNREEEANKAAEVSNVMEFGSAWEKVVRLVDLAPKADEKPGTSVVDRMRKLLIQLSHEKQASA